MNRPIEVLPEGTRNVQSTVLQYLTLSFFRVLYRDFQEMLMRDNRDFQIRVLGSGVHEEHMHSAVQLLYVADGDCEVQVREHHYEMHRDDVLLINAMAPHSFKVGRGSFVCELLIEYRVINHMLPDSGGIFLLNSLDEPNRPYEDIRRLFHELIWLELNDNHGTESRIYRDLYELLDILFLHCMMKPAESASGHRDLTDDEKLQQIISYVNGHYQESFSLASLAKKMYVSTSTLSRLFRRKTGVYFADYVNSVRLTYAVSEMRFSDQNLTRIASDCGFSSASVFSKLFSEQYGMPPNAYRKIMKEEDEEKRNQQESLRRELTERLHPEPNLETASKRDLRISVTPEQTSRCTLKWNRIVNIGSLADLTRANVQFHLLYMARELHVAYARIWSVFSSKLQITDGRTIGGYNFNGVDTVLDVLVENRLAVYFDFGHRPDMAVRTMDEAVYSVDTDIQFASRRAYESLFEHFISHLVNRYGLEEVSRWVFDFNEDPSYRGESRYYADPDYDFMNVWQFGYRTIRRLVPGARIGGPVGVPNDPENRIREFLVRAEQASAVPDFLSIIMFPYSPLGDGRSERTPEPDFEERQLLSMKRLLASVGMPELPIHVVDWNMSVSTRNYLNDSCFRGAYLCARAHVMMRHVSVAGIWVVSDWVSSYYDSRSILNGGGGMLSRDSIRKPAYYAMQFLSRLGSTVLFADRHMIVTMRNPGDYMILAVNDVAFHVNYFMKEESSIRPEDVESVLDTGKVLAIQLVIRDLADADEYIVKTRSVSRRSGSILDEWKRFRFETSLERTDVKYFQEICVPHMSLEHKNVSGGRLSVRIVLEAQEFRLLHIYRKRQ